MRNRLAVRLAVAFILSCACVRSDAASAQNNLVKPAVQTFSAKPIGQVVAATGAVTIQHADAVLVQANVSDKANQTRQGDPVYLGDIVRTGADGRVGINFTDGTSFSLSSNAQMTLDEYMYDPNGKSNSTLFSLAKGTFTFVAGKVAKTGDMKIDTPVATMGIRGTTPHVEISDSGSAKFSTLIEEGKSRSGKKAGQSPSGRSEQQTERKLNLNICRRC